ncbi:hypothetical protein DFQ28_010664 [Apophysomyces sp. BC1034]|nr:hypothetical protein DFQ30_007320 [Apophysomyces sp. BC1015]KAG0170719.1 hypothetical protein DFQ29_009148 [Apophysomyces sp. BC1021]KAG0184713.1 hypothetical protein DFQ28_010664 [Apophysomyces sp. BC1034]
MARSKKSTTAIKAQKSDDNASVRRSSRPKTVPELFMKQKQFATTAIRKRTEKAQEESSDEEEHDELDPEDSDSNSEDDSDDESANEDAESSTTRRKTTAKNARPKASGSTRKRRKAPPAETTLTDTSLLLEQVSMDGRNEPSLYDQMSGTDTSVEDSLKTWVESYKSDKMFAVRTLINFVIRSSGCMMAVTADAFANEDVAVQALQELQDELAKLPHHEYPIISRSKKDKVLKRNLLNFFQMLIDQCQHEEIYDGTLIETLQSWLTTMSSCLYRPFRHTSTIIALKIMSALCIVAEKARDELSIVTRQLATEKRKTGRAKNASKLRLLQQRSTTLQRKRKDLDEFLNDFFESIFVHRSRDIESVIRIECVKDLCIWMQQYPTHFVDNQYLRYFGWAFNDQVASVRSESVKSVIRLCKIENIVNKLNNFAERFKARIIEMAMYDVDTSVRVNAISLCVELQHNTQDILSPDERKQLTDLVVVDSQRVRKSVAPFVKAVIETEILKARVDEVQNDLTAMAVDAAETQQSGNRSSRPRKASISAKISVNKKWVAFKCIAAFLVKKVNNRENKSAESDVSITNETNSMIKNSTMALWGQLSELKDYQAMSDYLSRDHSIQQNGEADIRIENCYRLTEEEETALVSVFVACIDLAIRKGLDKTNAGSKEKKKDEKQLEEIRNEVSRHLVQVLPKLLTKHSDDAYKMQQLTSLPSFMNLSVYPELRMTKEYEELLQTLIKVYLGATSADLLRTCAESLQHMAITTSLAEVNDVVLPDLRERVVGQNLATARFSVDDIHSVSVSMLRLEYLSNCMDVTDEMDETEDMRADVTELVGGLLDRASVGYDREKQMTFSAMFVLWRYLVRKCERLSSDYELLADGKLALTKLEKRRDWVLEKYVELAIGPDATPLSEVRHHAFGIMLDIYWLFSSDLFAISGLKYLQLGCASDMQAQCAEYIASQVEKWSKQAEKGDQSDELDADLSDSDETTITEEELTKLTVSFARAVMLKVISVEHATVLLSQYGRFENELDGTIKALVEELKDNLVESEAVADRTCKSYLESLKESFEQHVDQSLRSTDKTLKLARLQSQSIKRAENGTSMIVSPHVLCERVHLDGITYTLSKAAEYVEQGNDTAKGFILKFFKVLSVFAKQISRARDVAKIHQHLEWCLQQHKLEVVNGDKEWDAYHAYIKAIDDVLKKKGLRYDASKRTDRVAEPELDDEIMQDTQGMQNLELENDDGDEVSELRVREGSKRPRTQVDEMDVDEGNSKRRR